MKAIDRRHHLAAAKVLQSLGDQSDRISSIVVDGQNIDPAEARRVAGEQPSGDIKVPAFIQRLIDKSKKKAAEAPPADAAASTKKKSLLSTMRQSTAVKKMVEFIKRDVANVSYHANVDVKLTNGVSDHFVVDVVDPTSSRKLRPVMLIADVIVALPLLPPGITSILLAPLALISGLGALYYGLKGDSAMRDTLKHMTYKELALIPIGELDQTGLVGVAALTADLTAGARSTDKAPTVAEMSRLLQWVQTSDAGKSAAV